MRARWLVEKDKNNTNGGITGTICTAITVSSITARVTDEMKRNNYGIDNEIVVAVVAVVVVTDIEQQQQ